MAALTAVLVAVHVLAAVVWVGGMFFAYMALRPVAASLLEPPLRLPLWSQVFGRFFPWVWAAVVLLPATGWTLILAYFGGLAATPVRVHVMNGLGILMILIFLHVWFAPYRRLRAAVEAGDWPAGARALARIRRLVGLNLLLGLAVAAVAAGGRYLGA